MTRKIVVIGQVLVDVILSDNDENTYIRLGGIMHAARALSGIGCDFGICYIAPDYLDEDIVSYANKLGAIMVDKIGSVTGSPNVIVVGEPKEYGPQRYEYLLRENHKISMDSKRVVTAFNAIEWSDALIFPGGFELSEILQSICEKGINLYIDVNFEPDDWSVFKRLKAQIDTIIISTSSGLFRRGKIKNADQLLAYAKNGNTRNVLLKENRGGCRFFYLNDSCPPIHIPAQVRPIVHSVGVGDCYDAVFAALRHSYSDKHALNYASCIAADYADTIDEPYFFAACDAWLKIPSEEISDLGGISLAWESRPVHQIYIAAPDFNYVDTRPIDALVESLKYHNFSPRRPIKEHGQATPSASRLQKRDLFNADMRLLDACSVLVAILLFDDPGTLIEIGIASEKEIPVVLYDPYKIAENLILTELPYLVSSDLDQIINAVFDLIQKANKK